MTPRETIEAHEGWRLSRSVEPLISPPDTCANCQEPLFSYAELHESAASQWPSVERQDDEDVQDVEGHRRHREEVDGDRPGEVIADERRPRLRQSMRPTAWLGHVPSYRILVDAEAELRELLRDPSPTPTRVLGCHPDDQLDDLSGNRRAADALWTSMSRSVQTHGGATR